MHPEPNSFSPGTELSTGTEPLARWPSHDDPVLYSPKVLASLAETVLNGYRHLPWGGVETGGILFGRHSTDGVHILAFRTVECEHHYGPSFELSAKDKQEMESLLAEYASQADLEGMVPVGWYHSVSASELAISTADRALHERFFGNPWQIVMVLKRSRKGPLAIGFFKHGLGDLLKTHSPTQAFPVVDFRIQLPELPPPPPSTSEPPTAAEPKIEAAAPALDEPAVTAVEPPQPVAEEPTAPAPESAATPRPSTHGSDIAALELASRTHIEISAPKKLPHVRPAVENPFAPLGLSEDPFSPVPDPRFLYPSPQHKLALSKLLHDIQNRKGFLALMGPVGTGKSLVLECLRDQLESHGTEVACLFNPKITPEELFPLLAHDLDLPCERTAKASILIALNDHLQERFRGGQTTVLIVDNAQKVSSDILEEMELLGNLENPRGRLMQIVFAAQPGFEQQLEEPRLRGLRQRLLSRARLTPLDAGQTEQYVNSRLAMAGLASQTIFPANILAEIHAGTQGVPRLINTLCSALLEVCLSRQISTVDRSILDRVSVELDLDRVMEIPDLVEDGI